MSAKQDTSVLIPNERLQIYTPSPTATPLQTPKSMRLQSIKAQQAKPGTASKSPSGSMRGNSLANSTPNLTITDASSTASGPPGMGVSNPMTQVNLDPHSLITPRPASSTGVGVTPRSSNGGSRFGAWSKSMFFTRHAPHPQRCKFITNMAGIRLCNVDDEVGPGIGPEGDAMIDFLQAPFNFPPSTYNDARSRMLLNEYVHSEFQSSATEGPNGKSPEIGIEDRRGGWNGPRPPPNEALLRRFPDSTMWLSQDTINTLQHFTGLRSVSLKQLGKEYGTLKRARALLPELSPSLTPSANASPNSVASANPNGTGAPQYGSPQGPRAKIPSSAVPSPPRVGVVPIADEWRAELKVFTDSVFGQLDKENQPAPGPGETRGMDHHFDWRAPGGIEGETEAERRTAAYSSKTGRLLTANDFEAQKRSRRSSSNSSSSRRSVRTRSTSRLDLALPTDDQQAPPPFQLYGLSKDSALLKVPERPPDFQLPVPAKDSKDSNQGKDAQSKGTNVGGDKGLSSRASTKDGYQADGSGKEGGLGENGTSNPKPLIPPELVTQIKEENASGQVTQLAKEFLVLQVLCQILSTSDLRVVRSWLRQAPPIEKSLALGLIRNSLNGQDKGNGSGPGGMRLMEDARKDPEINFPEIYETSYQRHFRAPVPLTPIYEASDFKPAHDPVKAGIHENEDDLENQENRAGARLPQANSYEKELEARNPQPNILKIDQEEGQTEVRDDGTGAQVTQAADGGGKLSSRPGPLTSTGHHRLKTNPLSVRQSLSGPKFAEGTAPLRSREGPRKSIGPNAGAALAQASSEANGVWRPQTSVFAIHP